MTYSHLSRFELPSGPRRRDDDDPYYETINEERARLAQEREDRQIDLDEAMFLVEDFEACRVAEPLSCYPASAADLCAAYRLLALNVPAGWRLVEV